MSLITSTQFASACASGTDWRDTSKTVLEQLDAIRTEDDDFNFGFIYISDHLTDDTTSILNLFKSVLKIDHWVGSVGMGVLGCSESLVDQPAISAMIGHFDEGSFCMLPDTDHIHIPMIGMPEPDEDNDEQDIDPEHTFEQWLKQNTPMLGVVHGNPLSEENPQDVLSALEERTNGFFVGGLSSSRAQHFHIAGNAQESALSGVLFADTTPVSTMLSQGCEPFSTFHTVTKADDNEILELNDTRALDVLQNDLKDLAAKTMDIDTDHFIGDMKTVEASDQIPEEFKSLFQGEVHIALPLSQSDQNDYLVRNIVGLDADEGSISISEDISVGDHIIFVKRDEQSVATDLSRALVNFRKRIQHERGCFEPKGALYISCIARGFSAATDKQQDEINLIKDIIGEVPMTGFYAGGEINNARLYGYTGILTVFF